VHLQFLDLTKTGKNVNVCSDEVIIHYLKMQDKKKVYPHKTPILPLSFTTCAISLVPGTCDISRFEGVPGLLDQPE
jgi:hypothetical protein